MRLEREPKWPRSRWPRVRTLVRGEVYKGARLDKVKCPKRVRVPNPDIDYSFDDGFHVSHPDAGLVLQPRGWRELAWDGWFFVAAWGAGRNMRTDYLTRHLVEAKAERREYPIDWE